MPRREGVGRLAGEAGRGVPVSRRHSPSSATRKPFPRRNRHATHSHAACVWRGEKGSRKPIHRKPISHAVAERHGSYERRAGTAAVACVIWRVKMSSCYCLGYSFEYPKNQTKVSFVCDRWLARVAQSSRSSRLHHNSSCTTHRRAPPPALFAVHPTF